MATLAPAQRARLGPVGPLVLLAGLVLILAAPMNYIIHAVWNTESGAHGPIVLFTGAWLTWKLWPAARPEVRPAPALRVALALAVTLPLYIFSRMVQIIEIQGFIMYAVVLTAVYGLIGGRAMRVLWFPLFYFAFMFPLPDTLVAALTGSLKMAISHMAVAILYQFGYPIGGAGVTIQVGQFQLLVAAACSGLNSIVALSAISLFYVYLRHQADLRYGFLLVLLILPVAVFANLIRVLILILLTYHAGEDAAQGFLHGFAGLTVFAVALLTIFALDSALEPLWRRYVVKDAHGRA